MFMANKKTATQLFNEVRDKMAATILSALSNEGYELIQVTDAKWSIPFVDAEGNEGWAQIAISQRKGSRDGDLYDGYTEGEVYQEKKAENARKAQERERKSAERKAEMERKKAEREAAKAAKEKEKEERGE